MSQRHALMIDDNRIWIRHRGRVFGPFDYEWSPDFCGAEFHYSGQKFGEYCSVDEIYVDAKDLGLPHAVSEVAVLVIGSLICGVLAGEVLAERIDRINQCLSRYGFCRFLPVEMHQP